MEGKRRCQAACITCTVDLALVVSREDKPPLNTESSFMSSRPYVEHISSMDKAINKVSNSPARKRARHPVSPPYSSTTLPLPSFPSRPGTSVAIEHRSEGVQMAKNRTKQSPSMSSNMLHPAMTTY